MEINSLFNKPSNYLAYPFMTKNQSENDPVIQVSFRLALEILNNDYISEFFKIKNTKNIIKHNNVKLFQNNENIEYVEYPVILLDNIGSYSHFLVDIIGKFLYIKKYFPETKPVLLFKDINQDYEVYKKQISTFKDIFKYLNIDMDQILKINLLENKKTFIFKSIYSIPRVFYGSQTDYQRFKEDEEMFKIIRKIFIPKEIPTYSKNIFIPREDIFDKRIGNTKKLQTILEENGYETVFFENLTLDEQIKLFYNAKNIIAITGTSLVNLLFANKDCNVLSVHSSPGFCAGEFALFAKSNNVKYSELYLQDDSIDNILNIFNLLKGNNE